jgi:hypothetical protein
MRRRLLWALTAIEAAIVLAVVYFEPSYGVRGILGGEAFFDGRPTSYWCGQIDRWLLHYESPEAALQAKWEYRLVTEDSIDISGYQLGSSGMAAFAFASPDDPKETAELTVHWAAPPTLEEKIKSMWTRAEPGDGRDLPKILSGLDDADAVWVALETDARYRPFVERTRRLFRAMHGFKTDADVARQIK